MNNYFRMIGWLKRGMLGWITIVSGCLMASADVSISERAVSEVEGGKRIVVQNECFAMELVPLGAQAVSFKTRNSDRQWLWAGGQGILDSGHLFMDNFLGQGSPQGELCFIKHDYQILTNGTETAEIRFSTLTKEKLRFIKTFAFKNHSPYVRVKLYLTNESDKVVSRGLWPKFDVHISGLKEKNRYYRPYERGVMVSGWNPQKKANAGMEFLRTPYAGWSAALQDDEQEGLVWLMDYNWLTVLYNCHPAWTVEWFYENLPLPPGNVWQTEYAMILVKGFSNIVHASSNIIAGMTMEAVRSGGAGNGGQPEYVRITHTLSRSLLGDLKEVKLNAQLREVDSDKIHPLEDLTVGNASWQPVSAKCEVKINPDVRLVCEVSLTAIGPDGKPVTESYVYYWPGMSGEKFNLIAGEVLPTYYRKPPKKVKKYPKPKEIVYSLNTPVAALEFRGLGYSRMRVMEAAAKAGIAEFDGSYFFHDWSGSKCSKVPTTYPELFSYDLFVFNGVDAQSVTDFGLEALRDFVKAGGSLLVIGGFYAYGPGDYADTSLEELLPVTLSGKPFDLERLSPPAALEIGKEAKILKGRQLKAKAFCFWRHQLTPKKDAWVELTAGNKPFLVCGTYGKGRVAAIASAAFGDPSARQPAFWESAEWTDVLADVIQWLVFGKSTMEEVKK